MLPHPSPFGDRNYVVLLSSLASPESPSFPYGTLGTQSAWNTESALGSQEEGWDDGETDPVSIASKRKPWRDSNSLSLLRSPVLRIVGSRIEYRQTPEIISSVL